MPYPPPPGLKSFPPTSSTPQPPAFLPPRPPPSVAAPASSSKSAFSHIGNNVTNGAKSAFTAFAPRSIASSNVRTNSPANFPLQPVTAYNGGTQYLQADPGYLAHTQLPEQSYGQPSVPQIRNPFAPPIAGTASSINNYGVQPPMDPEMEAQILQWQSTYMGKDGDASKQSMSGGYRREGPTGANTAPLGSSTRSDASTSVASAAAGPNAPNSSGGVDGAAKTVYRAGGGTTWADPSLLEWDPAHFRLFVGNLAGEVTDDSLLKAFSKCPSVQKARVVRDKRTTKSKGFGFVSFSDGDEYFQAARDMQGKYIGSHPVLLRRATTEVRAAPAQQKGGKHNKHAQGGAGGGGKIAHGGVQKKQTKTKGGLKILG